MTGHDDENLAYEDDQVLIVDKALQAKVDDAHPIRKTDQTSGVKTITSAKRKCIMCKGLAGLDEGERAKKTDRECYHPHCRARRTKENRHVTHGTFLCKMCEYKHREEMARLGVVEEKVYPHFFPDFRGDDKKVADDTCIDHDD